MLEYFFKQLSDTIYINLHFQKGLLYVFGFEAEW